MRQFHPGQALAHPKIEMVQRTGPHTHKNIILAQSRLGDIFVLQHLGAAKLVETDGFHIQFPAMQSI
jgi:hypothetical protein